jgi:hypothetical protein
MKRLVLAALVAQLAACEPTDEMLPLNPGGGGGTGSQFLPDAATTDFDASPFITGRVCYLLSNLQTPGTCAPEQGDFGIRLGSSETTTAIDGTFTIMRPPSTTGLYWQVSRGDVITSAIKFGAATTLPVLDALAYQEMVTAMQPIVIVGDGAVMVRVRHAGAAVSGATVAAQPAPESSVYYDGASDLAWESDATGTYGVAWIPSAPVGGSQLTITANAMPTTVPTTVFANTLTIVFAEIP